MKRRGLFGGRFDINRDGKLSIFERAAEFQFFTEVMNKKEEDKIEAAGLNKFELSFMEEEERNAVLEEAGIDPLEYDEFDY